MPMKPVPAVIVAAGSSTRLGQPKQLVVIDGESLLQRAIRVACEAGAEPVFMVLGANRELIEGSLDIAAPKIIVNEHWEEGLASSIRAGVEAVKAEVADAQGVLLMSCDQPRVRAKHLLKMINAFSRVPEGAIASAYAGTRGIPAIFPVAAFGDLCGLRGDKGARGLLANPSWPVVEVPLEGGEVDIDRPEDLEHLRR